MVLYYSFLLTQLPTINQPQTENALLNWALGIMVLFVVGAFGYLITTIKNNQEVIKQKDIALETIVNNLSEKNERQAILLEKFTQSMISHSDKIESLTGLLIESNKKYIEEIDQRFKNHTTSLLLKVATGELKNEKL